jgi:hypothetical protein
MELIRLRSFFVLVLGLANGFSALAGSVKGSLTRAKNPLVSHLIITGSVKKVIENYRDSGLLAHGKRS